MSPAAQFALQVAQIIIGIILTGALGLMCWGLREVYRLQNRNFDNLTNKVDSLSDQFAKISTEHVLQGERITRQEQAAGGRKTEENALRANLGRVRQNIAALVQGYNHVESWLKNRFGREYTRMVIVPPMKLEDEAMDHN